jgi:hypothetical protein
VLRWLLHGQQSLRSEGAAHPISQYLSLRRRSKIHTSFDLASRGPFERIKRCCATTGVSVHPPAYEDYLKALGGYRSTLYCGLRTPAQARRLLSVEMEEIEKAIGALDVAENITDVGAARK